MIKVENVSMKFRMNNDNVQSLKEFVIATAKNRLVYRDFWVFKDVSFEVKKGEVVGIIGRNGAGKSTLLKIISGILTPTSGKVELGGRVVPMLELGSGFDYELTGRENVFLNGSILGYSEEFLKEKYDEIVEFSELGEFIETPLRNYSSGMIMRLAFAIATIVQPEILIVDEILAVGDEAFQKKSKRKMLELMGGGTTVLFVSHSIGQIREMCNRVVWLEKGQVKMQGETKMVCDEYQKYINPVADSGDKKHKASDAPRNHSDVLFIYGDDENGYKWRVTCQREQLLAGGVPTNEIYYKDITVNVAKLYRVYVLVQCENTPQMREFLRTVKEYNKKVLFDFSLCKDFYKQIDAQEELLKAVPEYCDGVIVSNRDLEAYYQTQGFATFYNPLSIEERMVEYAAWSTYDRDILPFRKTEFMTEDELINYNKALAVRRKRLAEGKRIGFFCGTFENERFTRVQKSIVNLMERYRNITLVVEDKTEYITESMSKYADRIVLKKRVDSEDILRIYAEVDVVILVAEDEKKEQDIILQNWIYASLVKVPCIIYSAQKFDEKFDDNSAFVCQNESELEACLEKNVINGNEVAEIGKKAYLSARKRNCSVYTGDRFAQYVRGIMNPNIAFLMPNRTLGGYGWIACHHAALMKKEGYDVSILVQGKEQQNLNFDGEELPVISRDMAYSYQYMECMVAFDWSATRWMQNYGNVGKRWYLVQGFEPDCYKDGNMEKVRANQMYTPHTSVEYLTTSAWCQEWLRECYQRDAAIVYNGISCPDKINLASKFQEKIKILIIGDGKNETDGLEKAFQMVEQLDHSRYEICFWSYGTEPLKEFQFDRLYQNMSQEEIYKMYQECDILLQTNQKQCYQTAALDMMAAGGIVIAMRNQATMEYLSDQDNCILYNENETDTVKKILEKISEDTNYRNTLIQNGLKTAKQHEWKNFDREIIEIYKN